ncbi:MAG TPA: DNA polymerase Y family protein [Steroidobacteraceae bacterium]|nr:DNA polymerase Y family protein [Steroidobacteraceae bacterium]
MSARPTASRATDRADRKPAEVAAPALRALRLVPQQPAARPHFQARELWIGVHLPHLALEALSSDARREAAHPQAVVELQGNAPYVVVANGPAARAGVRTGMSVAAALALVPQLTTKPRDVRREQALLERLATCAQRFTPRVSLSPPDGVLLEVRGSLHLFGGAAALGASFRADCSAAGSRPRLALAPTALAALAAARVGEPFEVTDVARLTGALSPLPLAALRWPPKMLERLAKVGVRTIGEALRLPRGGFARRFGREPLAALDRLVGRSADLRTGFRAPERFRARRGFTYELDQHDALLAAITPLLERLAKFLEARQCGITRLECHLEHRHAPATPCVLELVAPAADPRRLKALLDERLAKLQWPEPVRSCELRSGKLVPCPPDTPSLWQPGEQGGGARAASTDLIECLRARLGFESVHGLEIHASHRPEAVSSAQLRIEAQPVTAASGRAPFASGAPAAPPWRAFRRPLWLLAQPAPLSEVGGLPCWDGPLRLAGEPERIETGWWDGEEVARDYYHAIDPRGARLWVFRERAKPHRWFLHGVFG